MGKSSRPDITSQDRVSSSTGQNFFTPVILGFIILIIVVFFLILFLYVIPQMAIQGAEKESVVYDRAVDQELSGALNDTDMSGDMAGSSPVSTPDPLLSSIESPFTKEEQKEEEELDS